METKRFTRNNYEDKVYTPNSQGRPPKDDGSKYDTTIEQKVMKGLPNSSYAVKVDPYTESNNPSTPYSFIAQFNKILGGRYSGIENLNGGNLIQYNSAVNSKFLKVFDCALMKLGLNYRYLPVLKTDTTRGQDMIDEMIKAIDEIVSSLNATTFKDQNIFYYGIETTLPMGSHTPTTFTFADSSVHQIYTDLAEVIYASCMEYQLILQDVIMVFNMFNANRTRMGTMIKMSWNREVPILNSYFGLLKKKSFLSLFDSIALNVQGEYIDLDWMRQANTMNMIASRRSNCINDPLLEIISYHNKPDEFKMWLASNTAKTSWIETSPVFDYADMQYTDPSNVTRTFDEAVQTLATRLSVEDTLDWARNVSNSNITETDRFNNIKYCLDVITVCLGILKTSFTDLRTVLTIMARIGVVNWSLGTRLVITKDTDCEITNYLVVKDLFEMVLGGSAQIEFNDTTKRWRGFSLWNLYYGTPEYANKSGGAFLSFAAKTLSYSGTPENLGYIPVAFTTGSTVTISGTSYNYNVVALNRKGTRIYIARSAETYANDPILERLVPLTSQASLQGYVSAPILTISDTAERSFAYRLLLQLAGVGKIGTDYALDPDYLAVFEYEIEDFTNEVISYCRGNGPFRVSSHVEHSLGFYGLAEGRK